MCVDIRVLCVVFLVNVFEKRRRSEATEASGGRSARRVCVSVFLCVCRASRWEQFCPVKSPRMLS